MFEYRATLVRIVDADTVDLDVDLGFRTWQRNVRFRLNRIDAPEMSTEAGAAARVVLVGMLEASTSFMVQTSKADSFGRWLAELYANGHNVNDLLVSAGHAVYRTYR